MSSNDFGFSGPHSSDKLIFGAIEQKVRPRHYSPSAFRGRMELVPIHSRFAFLGGSAIASSLHRGQPEAAFHVLVCGHRMQSLRCGKQAFGVHREASTLF